MALAIGRRWGSAPRPTPAIPGGTRAWCFWSFLGRTASREPATSASRWGNGLEGIVPDASTVANSAEVMEPDLEREAYGLRAPEGRAGAGRHHRPGYGVSDSALTAYRPAPVRAPEHSGRWAASCRSRCSSYSCSSVPAGRRGRRTGGGTYIGVAVRGSVVAGAAEAASVVAAAVSVASVEAVASAVAVAEDDSDARFGGPSGGCFPDSSGRALGQGYSAILYGSAARGDYIPGRSDINLMLVVDQLTPKVLRSLGPRIRRLAEGHPRAAAGAEPGRMEPGLGRVPHRDHRYADRVPGTPRSRPAAGRAGRSGRSAKGTGTGVPRAS